MGESVPDVTYQIPKWYFPRRFNVVILSFIAVALAYMMRSNLSIAILEMTEQFNWPLSSKGMFLSAFFWGYITTQLIGGMAARKFGPKNMILFVIVVPSIFTMCIPFVAPRSQILFVACRVLTGVASGATFPTMYLMLSGWIPFPEKASCLAIVFAGTNVGTIIIDTVGPVIMSSLGWQYVFFFSGGAGFIWMIFWYLTVTDTPQQMTNIHPSEVKYILETSESAPLLPKNEKINNYTEPEEPDGADFKPNAEVGNGASHGNIEALKQFAQAASFWNVVFCGFCTNWGSYIFLTWLPYYVHTDLGFDVQWAGIIAITPNISSAIVSFIFGKLCDVILVRGYNKLRVRKTFFITGCLMYGATLILLSLRERLNISNQISTVILAAGTGGAGLFLPGYTANIYDIAPYHPSLVVGISNTAGTIPGIVGVSLVGILLQVGLGWPTIWLITASFYGLAVISCFFFADVKRIV